MRHTANYLPCAAHSKLLAVGFWAFVVCPWHRHTAKWLSPVVDQTVWVPKHHSKLKTYSWLLHEQKCDKLRYDARWILDIPNKRSSQAEVSLQRDVCWNLDDDDDDNITDDSSNDENVADGEEEGFRDGYIKFLGFHPYKEVIFLCSAGYAAMAFSLNSSKFQYLGPILHLAGAYNRGQHEAFVYTPCLIGRYTRELQCLG